MKRILGLDLGTNSIGWALVEENTKIVASGVRIFPVGLQEQDYLKSGKEISKNATRRIMRMARRRIARYHQRREKLTRIMGEIDIPLPSVHRSSREIYFLRKKGLDEQISLEELGALLFLLNKRRGFKSNKLADRSSNDEKELGKVKEDIKNLGEAIVESNCRTVGEYFYSLFEAADQIPGTHPNETKGRIRHRFVAREMYEKEFEMLWEAQRAYYPEILTDRNKRRVGRDCIYYQRPLRSAKHLVSKCRFEPNSKVCPKSHWLFQEFRLWQKLNDIRVDSPARQREPLTQREKETLALYLHEHESIKTTKIKELLGLGRNASLGDIGEEIKGNTTHVRLKKALGSRWTSLQGDENPQKYRLWHTLHFFDNADKLEVHAREKMGLSEEEAHRYAKTSLEPDFGSISLKVIKKILPHMRAGADYADACELEGYHHSKEEDQPLKPRITPLMPHEIRNPIVQQATSEAIRLVNEVIDCYGLPDRIRIELPRELKKPKDKREKIRAQNQDKDSRRKEYAEFLTRRLGRYIHPQSSEIQKYELWLEMGNEREDLEGFRAFSGKVNARDQQKYELWLEAERISPYTGKTISLERLFSSEIEIEHILPYSRTMDNSFMNKTLSERAFNIAKGNDTPFEYFQKRSTQELEAFRKRIKHFPPGKQDKFLCKEIPNDFRSNQETNNAYIAQEVRRKVREVCKEVHVSNGQATAVLRRLWGMNTILDLEGTKKKNRDDHRHHAVDALVIACTSDRLLQILADYSQFDHLGKLSNDHIEAPWPEFREEAEHIIRYMLVSYRKDKRLSTRRKNILKKQSKEGAQIVAGVRGALHEETYYGKITHPETKKEVYVTRKELSWFTKVEQIEKVVDKEIRKLLIARIAAFGGNAKKAFGNLEDDPVWMYAKDPEKRIPITSVRIAVNDRMVQLRPNENPNLYAPTGNNFIIGIYEDAKGKRSFETVSLLEAIQRKQRTGSVLPDEKEGKALKMTLQQKDMVVTYQNHPDEIDWNDSHNLFNNLFVIRKMDATGRIGLAKHHLASVDTDKTWSDFEGGRKSATTANIVKVKLDILGNLTPDI